MDLSKLPRLSETDKHAPQPTPQQQQSETPQQREYRPVPMASEPLMAQIWLSLVLGIIFMMLGWTFARFLGAKLTGQDFHTGAIWQMGPKAGQEVDYFELEGYTAYTDTAIFLFGFSCVLEAVVMKFVRDNSSRSRFILSAALLVNVAMTVFNVIVAGMLFHVGITPLMSLLVIAFGGYSAMTQWQMLQQMRAMARR